MNDEGRMTNDQFRMTKGNDNHCSVRCPQRIMRVRQCAEDNALYSIPASSYREAFARPQL